jgi:hypothetical protein
VTVRIALKTSPHRQDHYSVDRVHVVDGCVWLHVNGHDPYVAERLEDVHSLDIDTTGGIE